MKGHPDLTYGTWRREGGWDGGVGWGGWGEGRLSGREAAGSPGCRPHPVSLPRPRDLDLTSAPHARVRGRGCHFLPHTRTWGLKDPFSLSGSLGPNSDKDGWLSPPHAPQPPHTATPTPPRHTPLTLSQHFLCFFFLGKDTD